MLCGSGCQRAHDQVVASADRLKAPIVHAFRSKEHIEWDNPFDVGMTGLYHFHIRAVSCRYHLRGPGRDMPPAKGRRSPRLRLR
jgi:hypothetical protein